MVEASKERGLLFRPLLVGSRIGVSSLEPHTGPRWTVHRTTSAPRGRWRYREGVQGTGFRRGEFVYVEFGLWRKNHGEKLGQRVTRRRLR